MSDSPYRDPNTWPAPADRDHVQWVIECQLRDELLASAPEDREAVTRDVYNRLFEQVPWHEANHIDTATATAHDTTWFQLYGFLCSPGDTLVDLGCGSGGLIRAFAGAVHDCIGIDTSDAMIELAEQNRPPNARFMTGNLIEPPIAEDSADIVITRQVLEHLHPDDIERHLATVLRILRPGGRFLIETPSRLTGPWDISRAFTASATGFHLHEYTNGELARVLRRAGFGRVRTPALPSRAMMRLGDHVGRAYIPVGVKAAVEHAVALAPTRVRRAVAGPLAVREVAVVAWRTT